MIDSRPRTPPWWIPPAVLLCVFGLLLWQVVAHGPLTTLDVHVRNGIQDAATGSGLGWLAAFGRGCADLGDEAPAILSLLLAAAAATFSARSRRPPLLAAGAGIVLATVIPLKIWVGRPGPGELTLGNASLGFFPSGHTADAVCCYVTAGYLLAAYVWTSRRARQALGGIALGLVLLTVFGLLWSNYHWLTDVLGSLCWCGAWLLVLAHLDRAHLDQARAYPRGRR